MTRTLHDVAAAGAYREIAKLVADGAPVDDVDAEGRTPLDVAIATGCGDTIAILRSHGAKRRSELGRANALKAQKDLVVYLTRRHVSACALN